MAAYTVIPGPLFAGVAGGIDPMAAEDGADAMRTGGSLFTGPGGGTVLRSLRASMIAAADSLGSSIVLAVVSASGSARTLIDLAEGRTGDGAGLLGSGGGDGGGGLLARGAALALLLEPRAGGGVLGATRRRRLSSPSSDALERGAHLARGLEAVLGPLLEGLHADRLEAEVDLRVDVRSAARGISSTCLMTRRILLVGDEGQPAREQLIEDDAERVDVAPRVGRLAARLLGRHVLGRADEHPVRGERAGVRRASARLPSPLGSSSGSTSFAMPKSHTFTTSIALPSSSFDASSMMFSGFRSRWMTPISCATASAASACERMPTMRSRESGHSSRSTCRRSRPWRNSIAM